MFFKKYIIWKKKLKVFYNFFYFKIIFRFLISKNNFLNFKNVFLKCNIMWQVTSAPRGKSCTVSNCHVAKAMPLQCFCGVRDLFQTNFFLQGRFSNFFFTRTKIIFKPKKTRLNYTFGPLSFSKL